ncbi:hypothetical protein DY000_02036244 [Brassica cretica]|uniref:Uncharacterized protein n=1 Tax=Brassica cretica TaxID=69181 RepID=A0ABQ7BHC6_BRACR|nr:hypothetical protein DY000_02036244 [Brassica cretica]
MSTAAVHWGYPGLFEFFFTGFGSVDGGSAGGRWLTLTLSRVSGCREFVYAVGTIGFFFDGLGPVRP